MSNYSYNGKTWNLVSEEENEYEEGPAPITKPGHRFNSNIPRDWESFFDNSLSINDYRNSRSDECYISHFYELTSQVLGAPARLTKKTTTTLFQGVERRNANKLTEFYKYLYSGVLKKKIVYGQDTDPDKEEINIYVGEQDDSDPNIAEMKKKNILTALVSSTTYGKYCIPKAIYGTKIDYMASGLPSKLSEFNLNDNYYDDDECIDPNEYEPSIEVESYDDFGNPTEIVDLKTGVHSVFLWDAQGRYMTALIKNATLSDVDTIPSGTSLSRYMSLKGDFSTSLIETWDYLPLIGVSAHTDVNGQTILYDYDDLGRLKREKRMVINNNKTTYETIHEYEYNYKNGMK